MPPKHPALLLPPVARAAYSDRTAWLLAEMSRFAYLRFESPGELLDDLVEKISGSEDRTRIKRVVESFLDNHATARGPEAQALEESLKDYSFELVETFNSYGTQAFLAKRDSDGMAVLAFRGTEPKDIRDIKADLDARFYSRNGAKIHNGFHDAFGRVEAAIKHAVSQLGDHKLYITGHSLGGALALIATKSLSSDSVAACYTFGSPRVGDIEFNCSIKIPIYRVVNAADAVPRVPPTWSVEACIFLMRWFPAPYVRSWLIRLLSNFVGYRHHGDMRYLTACKDDFSDMKLIPNPDLLDRFSWMVHRLLGNLKAGIGDHSISEYCSKLEAYAARRQA